MHPESILFKNELLVACERGVREHLDTIRGAHIFGSSGLPTVKTVNKTLQIEVRTPVGTRFFEITIKEKWT